MRLWSLHPRHLDARGLVALWREGLLARAVLNGQTRGYTQHPQLERFRALGVPAIDAYLHAVADEAKAREYRFDVSKLGRRSRKVGLEVTDEQLAYEWAHLLAKLERRDPAAHARSVGASPAAHPIFVVVAGPVAAWERPRSARQG